MIYNPMFYNYGYEDPYDLHQRERYIDNYLRLQRKKNFERQRRERAEEIAKQQMKLKKRENEQQRLLNYLRRSEEENRINFLDEKERRRRYISDKLEREEEKPILLRGSDGRLYRNYFNDSDHISNRKSKKDIFEGNDLCKSTRLSHKIGALDMDARIRGRVKGKNFMDATSEVESSIKDERKKTSEGNVPMDSKIKNDRNIGNGAKSCVFRDAIVVEDSSDDEDESLVWTKLRPSQGQWMEPVD